MSIGRLHGLTASARQETRRRMMCSGSNKSFTIPPNLSAETRNLLSQHDVTMNIPQSLLDKLESGLHKREDHPLGIIKGLVEGHLNGEENTTTSVTFDIFDKYVPNPLPSYRIGPKAKRGTQPTSYLHTHIYIHTHTHTHTYTHTYIHTQRVCITIITPNAAFHP